jgi:hypothetical protein
MGLLATVAGAMTGQKQSVSEGIPWATLPHEKPWLTLKVDGTLIVRDGEREASVTRAEIIDALLPVKPNHCPACGKDCMEYVTPFQPWLTCPRCRCMFGRD